MNLKLKCIKDFCYKGALGYCDNNGDGEIKTGTTINAMIGDEGGIRIKINNVYSFPFCVSDIEKYFIATN